MFDEIKAINKRILTSFNFKFQQHSHFFSLNLTNNSQTILEQLKENNSLLIKKLLCPPVGIYLHEPIAHFFLSNFFSKNESTYISNKTKANLITTLCVLVSLPIFILLVQDSSKTKFRRLACILFQTRNVLDFMDGALARFDEKKMSLEPDFDVGRIYDAFGSSCPTLFFLLGSYIFILNTLNIINGVEEHEINKLDFFYRNLHRVMNWLSNKLVSTYKFQITNTTSKLDHMKEVYYNLTKFFIYIILAGIVWNKVLDSNKFIYGDYQIYIAVSWNFCLVLFAKLSINITFFYFKNMYDKVFLIDNRIFFNLMLWRYISGITVLDVYCGFVWFNNDWVQ